MATQGIALTDLYSDLLSERELRPRARHLATHLSALLAGSAVAVYLLQDEEWKQIAAVGEVELEPGTIPMEFGTLGAMYENRGPMLHAAADLNREDYGHLNLRHSFHSLAYLPIASGEEIFAAVEIIGYQAPLTEDALEPAIELMDVAAIALRSALVYEEQVNANLSSISRLTELYDLELAFTSTLEMSELYPIITAKTRELLECQAVNLWLVETADALLLAGTSGIDPTVTPEQRMHQGDFATFGVSDNGEPIIVSSEEALATRNAGAEDGAIFSLVAVPVVHNNTCVGVLEAVNRLDGQPFDEDDQFLLSTIAEAAGRALQNGSLLMAERKVEVLETLVNISTEMTSTLNLERVLMTIVNGAANVIPYERAAISLELNGRLVLKAISGAEGINNSDPNVIRLKRMLEWAAGLGREVFVRQHDEQILTELPDVEDKFREYFADSGVRCFLAIPLADDQGRVGILSLESTDPDFLLPVHRELLKVLTAQATVALRNAELYREVPFIDLLEPLMAKKHQFMSMEARKRKASIILAVATLAFLAFFPLPMRVEGPAQVAPQYRAQVQPEVEGVIRKVHVREGDSVAAGTILAEMEDWQYRSAHAAAEAKYQMAVSQMNQAMRSNDSGVAGQKRIEADYWQAEAKIAAERLERTKLRSPIDGVVATPYVENFIGKHLDPGDSFAEVVDNRSVSVDVQLSERDVALVEQGNYGVVKLDSFPTRLFSGDLAVISPSASLVGEDRMFAARVRVENPDAAIRPGMQGRGKVSVGWKPAGYVMFRSLAMWLRSKIWGWVGW